MRRRKQETKERATVPPTDKVETILGPGTRVEGTIRTTAALRVEGSVEGHIVSEADVVIGESGRIKAEVAAQNLTVSGEIKGNVTVTGKLCILASGKLYGTAKTGTLIVEPGAVWQGESRMDGDAAQAVQSTTTSTLRRSPNGETQPKSDATQKHAPKDGSHSDEISKKTSANISAGTSGQHAAPAGVRASRAPAG